MVIALAILYKFQNLLSLKLAIVSCSRDNYMRKEILMIMKIN